MGIMTLRQFAPIWSAAISARHALRAERKAHKETRFVLAVVTAERDRARELVAAMTCEGFSAEDEAMVGSWLEGERPA